MWLVGLIIILIILYSLNRSFKQKKRYRRSRNRHFENTSTAEIGSDSGSQSKATLIGEEGEQKVKIDIETTLRHLPGKIHIMNDAYFYERNQDKPFQIDHLLIGRKGIVVIETKNWSGTLYGDKKRDKWVLYDLGRNKHEVYSPIRQNERHMAKLSALLRNEFPLHSLVIFTSEQIRLKVEAEIREVTTLQQLEETIKRLSAEKDTLGDVQVDELYDRLLKMQVLGNEIKVKQVEYASAVKTSREKSPD